MGSSGETPRVWRFGVFELDTQARELRRQGVRIRLQDQPYQILLLLLQRAGEVVTREELRQRVWPSSVFVDFDHGLNNAVARLREALGDDASSPRFIETLPRLGYRFIERVAPVADAAPAAVRKPELETAAGPAPVARKRWRLAAASALVLALAATIFGLAWFDGAGGGRSRDAAVSPAPSIAVLPFANLSTQPDDEYFADGLTEEVVSKLAGIRGLKVVARTSSFRFKGKQEPAAGIAQALGVSYLLEGSVRRSGERLRIAAQLIDAQNDTHLWAETYDREAADIFRIQEEIAFAVASALRVSLLEEDRARIAGRGTSDAEAYRLYLIGIAHLHSRTTRPSQEVAKRSLEAAIERDPDFAAAHAGLARWHFLRAWSSLQDTEDSPRLGLAEAERAVALDPASTEALQARANFQFWRYRFRGDYASLLAGEADMKRAIELDPASSFAYEDFGRGILWDNPQRATTLFEQALRVDPLGMPPSVQVSMLMGARGQLEAGRQRCAQLLERAPDAVGCRMAMATLDTYFGEFEPALALMRQSQRSIGGATRIQLWALHMSMGDRAGALQWLDFGEFAFEKALSEAARLAMDARYAEAFAVLDRERHHFPQSRLLDLPAAKFALLAGKPREALAIHRTRLPDLVSGIEPVSARNLLPAIDLATAQFGSGAAEEGRATLARVVTYLDGPGVLRLPLFAFQRARVHALAGEREAALQALERAYEEGMRMTWALDMRPQSFLYIDPLEADPAFDSLRTDPRYVQWLARMRDDNARQFARIAAATPAEAP